MITSIANNLGIPQVSFKDYQTQTLTVIQGTFQVDPTSQAWQNADQIVFEFPALTMQKSAVSQAYMIGAEEPDGSTNVHRRGTVLKTWLKDNKLFIEKVSVFDEHGPFKIFLGSAFVTRGQRVNVIKEDFVETGITDAPSRCGVDKSCMMVKEHYMFFLMGFSLFNGRGDDKREVSFNITNFPSDVTIDFPVCYRSNVNYRTGSALSDAHIENGHLETTNPSDISYFNNPGTWIMFFAVRDGVSPGTQE